jgi:hypothetical protein
MELDRYPRVIDEPSGEEYAGWWSIAVPLYTQALIVCNSALGWPDLHAVLDINNGMYPSG